MKSQKFLSILLIFLLLGVSACVNSPRVIEEEPALTGTSTEATLLVVNSPTFSPQPTVHPTATPTPTPITSATQQEISPPESSFAEIVEKCLELDPNFEPSTLTGGTILFWMIDQFDALDRNSESIAPFKRTSYVMEYAVSPDRKWLAYIDEDDEARLVVVSANGEELTNLSRPGAWGQLVGWLDHKRLVFVSPNLPKGSIILVNPFSNQVQEFIVSLPDVDESINQPWPLLTIYNPDLTRVAYLSSKDQDGNGTSIKFWDLENLKLLWELKSTYAAVAAPAWSPDGTQLVAALPTKEGVTDITMELFSIKHDGQPKQLTNLGVKYAFVFLGPHLVWSPDGRYIAFWASLREKPSEDPFEAFPPSHLMVLDLQENRLTDYCVGGLGASNYPPSIIWAPDSQQMIVFVGRVDDTGTTVHDIILVDITNVFASKITENRVPIGWLDTMP